MKSQGVVNAEDWKKEEVTVNDPVHGPNITRATYTSPAMKLAPGQAHFTLNPLFKIPVPKGDYVFLNAQWDIVDSNGEGVPLTELYNHHWLIGTRTSYDPLAMCEEE